MGIEHYTRVRKLGKGSFGEVFLVVDKRNGCQYVMKEIDIAQFGPKGRREALKEVAFLNAMHHPCIVAYREFFEHDNGHGHKMLYIVMEYADGGDLDGRIKQQHGRLFPESLILEWFVQVCLAVKHIHDRKILHRDLKAENIFLMKGRDAAHPSVKLGDFGISKSMAHTMANAITRIGTPYYLSPEICMNKPYNSKSDMWSLGAVLYEMMSLKHPFDATSMEGLLNKIVKHQPPPLPKTYSIELRTVVDSLLSKQPAKRPNVNALLTLPFLAQYVSRALSPQQMADEFSHTVIHSDASARGSGVSNRGAAMPMPQSNKIVQRAAAPGVRAKPQRAPAQPILDPLPLPQVPPVRQQHQQHPSQHRQPQYSYEEHKEAVPASQQHIRPAGAASPYRQAFQHAPAPPSARPPSSHRPQSAQRSVYGGGVAGALSPLAAVPRAAVPPSPYAGLSNAEAIRMIREKKEAELREARAAQFEQQRRREHAEAMMAEEGERDRAMRARELQKERQLAAAANAAQQDYHLLPPVLRHQAMGGGGGAAGAVLPRGIPSVVRRGVDSGAAATPLHGAPYQHRAALGGGVGGAPPTRLQQQEYQAAEVARKAREDELARMRVKYFRERKQNRESKLAAVNQAALGSRASRPPSSDRYASNRRHHLDAPAPRWR